MTDLEEQDLRAAFEECIQRLRSGERIARIETLQCGIGVNAVITVVGEGSTFRVVDAVNRVIDKAEKAAS